MSQIEIDKSKKVFDNISMSKELRKMRNMPYIKYIESKDNRGTDCKKMVVPMFFKNISSANEFREFEKFDTPLDILQDVFTFKGGRREKNVELKELLVRDKYMDGKFREQSALAIYNIIYECGRKINGLRFGDNDLSDNVKHVIEKKYKNEAMEKLLKLTPNDSTVLRVIKYCLGEKDKMGFKKYGMLCMSMLFETHRRQFLMCFKSKNISNDEVLIKVDVDDGVNIFGNTYHRTTLHKIL